MDFYVVLIIAILAIAAVASIVWFFRLPSGVKIQNLKEWLKYGVIEAEKALGSGTGQIKLRFVYDMAAERFPWMVNMVSFAIFTSWVDEALDWMKLQLAENKNAQDYVGQ